MRLNDRPLTYTSSDGDDLLPITPSHLIYGFRLGDSPNLGDDEEFIDPSYGCKKNFQPCLTFVYRTKFGIQGKDGSMNIFLI